MRGQEARDLTHGAVRQKSEDSRKKSLSLQTPGTGDLDQRWVNRTKRDWTRCQQGCPAGLTHPGTQHIWGT